MGERGEPHSYRRALSPEGEYSLLIIGDSKLMEMAVRLIETAETVMETDGDGSGGTFLSRQGAGTETSIPRNLSSMVAALRNCSGKNTD
jgi:hypothetical protein